MNKVLFYYLKKLLLLLLLLLLYYFKSTGIVNSVFEWIVFSFFKRINYNIKKIIIIIIIIITNTSREWKWVSEHRHTGNDCFL